MPEAGTFSSPRTDAFPAGLRVLVVDDDPTWLRILQKMLKKCLYEVTTCCLARDALSLLRERKEGFDIVISDVNMPDMDGFKLLEHVGLEMDLPVIMMSVDGETSRVMKGVQHGACDYLLKPIRMKELRNIWQHVLRKKIHEIEHQEGIESIQTTTRTCSEQADNVLFLTGEEMCPLKKRKDHENKNEEKDFYETSSNKKARVVWSVDLHQKFVKAVNQIGFDKVGPKKILDLMNVPWLTRENVASHLQKYRLYLSRLPKVHGSKDSIGGNKHLDSPSKDSVGSCSLQSSISMQEPGFSDHSYSLPVRNSPIQNMDHMRLQGECKGSTSVNESKQNRALVADVPDPPRKAMSSGRLLDHSSTSFEPGISLPSFSSSTTAQYSWNDVPVVPLKQECQTLHLDDGFSQRPLPAAPHEVLVKYLQPALPNDSGSSVAERGAHCRVEEIEPLSTENVVNHVNRSSSSGSAVPFSTESNHKVVLNDQVFEPLLVTTSTSKSPCLGESCVTDLGYTQKHVSWGVDAPSISLDGELQFYLHQGDSYAMDIGHQPSLGFAEYHDMTTTISEIPFHLYDAVRFEYQNHFDSSEYYTIDQGSFHAVPTRLW